MDTYTGKWEKREVADDTTPDDGVIDAGTAADKGGKKRLVGPRTEGAWQVREKQGVIAVKTAGTTAVPVTEEVQDGNGGIINQPVTDPETGEPLYTYDESTNGIYNFNELPSAFTAPNGSHFLASYRVELGVLKQQEANVTLNDEAQAAEGTSLPLVQIDDENAPLFAGSQQDNTTWNLTDYHAPAWRSGTPVAAGEGEEQSKPLNSADVDSDASSAKGVAGGYSFTALETVVTVKGESVTGLRAHSGHIILAGVAADNTGSATDPDLDDNNIQVSKVTVALEDVLNPNPTAQDNAPGIPEGQLVTYDWLDYRPLLDENGNEQKDENGDILRGAQGGDAGEMHLMRPTITGQVWMDDNNDGLNQSRGEGATEAGVAGMQLTLERYYTAANQATWNDETDSWEAPAASSDGWHLDPTWASDEDYAAYAADVTRGLPGTDNFAAGTTWVHVAISFSDATAEERNVFGNVVKEAAPATSPSATEFAAMSDADKKAALEAVAADMLVTDGAIVADAARTGVWVSTAADGADHNTVTDEAGNYSFGNLRTHGVVYLDADGNSVDANGKAITPEKAASSQLVIYGYRVRMTDADWWNRYYGTAKYLQGNDYSAAGTSYTEDSDLIYNSGYLMASQVSGGADEYTVLLDAPNDETVESTKAGALNSNNPNQNTPDFMDYSLAPTVDLPLYEVLTDKQVAGGVVMLSEGDEEKPTYEASIVYDLGRPANRSGNDAGLREPVRETISGTIFRDDYNADFGTAGGEDYDRTDADGFVQQDPAGDTPVNPLNTAGIYDGIFTRILGDDGTRQTVTGDTGLAGKKVILKQWYFVPAAEAYTYNKTADATEDTPEQGTYSLNEPWAALAEADDNSIQWVLGDDSVAYRAADVTDQQLADLKGIWVLNRAFGNDGYTRAEAGVTEEAPVTTSAPSSSPVLLI